MYLCIQIKEVYIVRIHIKIHSSLKSEEFMFTKFNSISEKDVRQRIDHYIKYYNEERIQEKLGYHAPKTFGSMPA
ncbi:IS3 family transposase [Bacillus altitudinis]|nr:IS3 family transposase [Bacillus altitudinis]